MNSLTVGRKGEIALPNELRKRYGIEPNSPVRVVETRNGILLFPLTDQPMDEGLAKELEEWQTLGAESWTEFPYEDAAQN